MNAADRHLEPNWQTVCETSELESGLGLRALIEGRQVAVFKVQGELYAISAIDPFTKAAVLSRGLVGDVRGQLVVASPLYKQHFNLRTGQCLEDDAVSVRTYPVRAWQGTVQVALGPS